MAVRSETHLVGIAFFLSGAAALVFEVVWFHRAALVFGNTIGAASVVLASFMGGLALGTAIVAWQGQRLAHLRAYAAIEAAAAIAGITLTYVLPLLPAVLAPLVSSAGARPSIVMLFRLATGFTVMLVPTTAMGATLPVLVGSLSSGRSNFGPTLGSLYGWNTLGGVVGVITAERVLIAFAGVAGTAWFAGLLNLSAAAIVLRLTSRAPDVARRTRSQRPTPSVSRQAGTTPPAWLRHALLGSAALAGAALLALEVVWFRFLSMYLLTTTLILSMMLAVVLGAIGLGGFAASSWLEHRRRATSPVPTIAFLAGSSVALSYLSFQWLTHGTQLESWQQAVWLSAALTAATSFLSGMLFTAIGSALRDVSVEAGDSGDIGTAARLLLANTIGAMCGSPLAALVLLPLLGMERTVFAAATAYGVIGLVTMLLSKPGVAAAQAPAAVLSGVGLMLCLVMFPFGLMTDRYFSRAAQAYEADGSAIVATREGSSETIFLMQQTWLGRAVYHRLVTNGFSMTGTAIPGQRYMRYFAYWPMLLHQTPVRRALMICYGVGITASAVLDIPTLESLDIVEISPQITAVSDLIYPPARHPLHDPRSRLHIEDGRVYLQTTGDRFDLITGEPPPPRTPGAANIYSREYFQLIYNRLAEGGIATYWLPVARPSPGTDVNTIIRAFCDVFADCSMWNGTPFDFMLVGTRRETDSAAAASWPRVWEDPSLAARLREVGFEQPEQIGATFIGDADFLRQLTVDTPPLTDNFPRRLEPAGSRRSLSDPRYPSDPAAAEMYQRAIDSNRARQAFAVSPYIRRWWPPALIAASLPYFEQQRMINRVIVEGGRPLAQIEDLHAVLTRTALQTLPLWLLGSDDVKQQIAESSEEQTPATVYARGLRSLAARDYTRAAERFGEADRGGLRGDTVRPLQVYALCLAGNLNHARQLAHGASLRSADEQHFWTWLGSNFGIEPW